MRVKYQCSAGRTALGNITCFVYTYTDLLINSQIIFKGLDKVQSEMP